MRIWKISRTNEAAGVKQPDLPGERCMEQQVFVWNSKFSLTKGIL